MKALREAQDRLQSSLAEADSKLGSLNNDLGQANSAKEELEQLLRKEMADANLKMLSESCLA